LNVFDEENVLKLTVDCPCVKIIETDL